MTSQTQSCFRSGRWHADELANLCQKMEGKLAEAIKQRDDWMKCAEDFYDSGPPNHNQAYCLETHGPEMCSHHRAMATFRKLKTQTQ